MLARHETSISLQSLNCDAHPVCGPSGTLSSPLVCLVSWAVWLRVNGPSAVGKVELSAGSSGLCCASPRAGLRRMGLHAKLSHASVLGRGHGSNFISSRTRFTLGLMCVGQRGRSLNWEKIELLLSSYYVPYAELGFLHTNPQKNLPKLVFFSLCCRLLKNLTHTKKRKPVPQHVTSLLKTQAFAPYASSVLLSREVLFQLTHILCAA